jgi:hypothetical protein
MNWIWGSRCPGDIDTDIRADADDVYGWRLRATNLFTSGLGMVSACFDIPHSVDFGIYGIKIICECTQ